MDKLLALIPARGGSKGIPRKNIKVLGEKPLIQYSIELALSAGLFAQVVVSTDDPKIAQLSQELGAAVPFLRPKHLATDHSPSIDTIVHALHFFQEKGDQFDAVCLLQPTVPFRASIDLKLAIEHFRTHSADSLVSMRQVPHQFHPHWVFESVPGQDWVQPSVKSTSFISRRQELPKALYRDGAIYLTKTEVLLQQHSLYGQKMLPYEMQFSPDINLDTMNDWHQAERYLIDQSHPSNPSI